MNKTQGTHYGYGTAVDAAGKLFHKIAHAVSYRGSESEPVRKDEPSAIIKINSKDPEIIAVFSPFFRGVGSATREMVRDTVEVLEIQSSKSARRIASQILEYNPKKILISGYARGHENLAQELKSLNSKLRIFVLIHSAFIWFDCFPEENYVFERYVRMVGEGTVEKIGFCKRDVAEYFRRQGLNSYFVMNRFYPEKHRSKKMSGKPKIGIWGQNHWHRNITNQVIGALMINDCDIHVNEVSDHFFIDRSRINVHGILSKDAFLELLSDMDVNSYVSMTECFPMTVIESLQYCVPCLVSDTSDVYAFSPYLKDKLTVSTVDSPLGIARNIEDVITRHDEIQDAIVRYLPILKEETEASIKRFLE